MENKLKIQRLQKLVKIYIITNDVDNDTEKEYKKLLKDNHITLSKLGRVYKDKKLIGWFESNSLTYIEKQFLF